MKLKTIRGLVCLLTFIIAIVGLVVHTGMGTISSLGWRDISAICPVGALEVLAGAKAFLVHPIVLLVLMVVVVFFVGRAFCSWMCPVPHIRNFFGTGKKEHKEKEKRAQEAAAHATAQAQALAESDRAAVAEAGPEAAAQAEAQAAGEDEADAGASEGATVTSAAPAVVDAAACEAAAATATAAAPEAEPAPADDAPKKQDRCGRSKAPLAPIGGERDGFHIDSRHFVLLGTLVSSFAFGFPVFCLICPVGLCFAVVIGVWNMFRFSEVSLGLIVFPLIILAEVVFFRRWCTTFCPISALLSLIAAKSRFLRPVVQKHTCLRTKGIDCKTCVQVCPEHVDPHSKSIPECSRCGDCAERCPAKAITFPFLAKADKDEPVEAMPLDTVEANE